MVTLRVRTISIKPEDILPDTENFVELNGTIVRKGSIAAFLKNIDLLEDPNNTEKDEVLKMLKQLAPAIIASGLHRHVVFKNQTISRMFSRILKCNV